MIDRLPLTTNEQLTLDTIHMISTRYAPRTPIPTASIANRNTGVSYEQTTSALAGLVRKGYLTKPRRGIYILARTNGSGA